MDSDFTIGKGSNASYDFRVGNGSGNINITLHTDDEAGIARTITLAARVYTEQNTSSITVAGHGTNIITSASSGMTGTYALTGTATAIFNADAGFGEGSAISLGAGTTLIYSNSGHELSLPCSSLILPSEGTATLRIDGYRLRGGDHVLASGVAEGADDLLAVDPAGTALGGRKATLRVDEVTENEETVKKLILNIVSSGLILSFM